MDVQVILIDPATKTDLVFSPDDGGWYFQRGDQTSVLYDTKGTAMAVWRKGWVTWHPVE